MVVDNSNSDDSIDSSSEGSSVFGNSPFSNLKKQQYFPRKRLCPLHGLGDEEISFKNPDLLKRFISERGKIMPRRITSVQHGKQIKLALEIKKARFLSILPYQLN